MLGIGLGVSPVLTMQRFSNGLVNSTAEYWPLDEPSGARVGVKFGTVMNDVNTVGSATGIINDAANFAEANLEHLQIGAGDNARFDFPNRSYTWSFWINMAIVDPNDPDFIIGKYGSSGNQYFIESFQSRIRVRHVNSNGLTISTIQTPATLINSTWYHILCGYDDSAQEIRLWYNNTAVTPVPVVGSAPSTPSLLTFGASSSNSFFYNGVLDEVGCFYTAPTSYMAEYLYGGGTPPAWPFADFDNNGFDAGFDAGFGG